MGRTLFRGYQLLQCPHVPKIVTRFVDGSFEDKGLVAQFRMLENAAKAFHSNITSAYVRVAVAVGIEGGFGVVGMNDGHVFEAERGGGFADQLRETGFVSEIESADVAVAGIEAISDGNI